MDVSVVIPTYNGKQLLEAYLPSVLSAAGEYRKRAGEVEVVVVVDGGADGTVEWLDSTSAGAVRLGGPQRNPGVAEACTSGFRAARFPVLFLPNNDVRVK